MRSHKQQIEALFDACVALNSAEQRDIYLSRACGEDTQLRLEIEELLQAHEKAGGFLAATISENRNESLPLTSSARFLEDYSSLIGRYKLLEKIGEGGMGVVYMAEQGEPVRRRTDHGRRSPKKFRNSAFLGQATE